MSPIVMLPSTTRMEACHSMLVTAMAMIAWPMFSPDKEVLRSGIGPLTHLLVVSGGLQEFFVVEACSPSRS